MDFRVQTGSINSIFLKKKILFGVLDWGLGHASRSIPLIDSLLQNDIDISVVSSGSALTMLTEHYPYLPFFELPAFNIRLSTGTSSVLKIACQLPHFYDVINKEHKITEKLIRLNQYDGIISDNRYGLWSKKVPAIFITHQLFIKAPNAFRFSEPLINKINHHYIKKFDSCWVPDFLDITQLSGRLSHFGSTKFSVEYIGPLSRFSSMESDNKSLKYEAIAILSGPEPQRSIFEEILVREMNRIDADFCLVRGLPESGIKIIQKGRITIHNYLDSNELSNVISKSKLVICRSGYSSIMDLAALGAKALLVPTPGQSEQEYLASYHQKLHHYLAVNQNELDLPEQLKQAIGYPGMKNMPTVDLLKKSIDRLIGKL